MSVLSVAAAPLAVVALGLGVIGSWTQGFRAFTSFSTALVAAGPLPRRAPPLRVLDAEGMQRDVSAPTPGMRLVHAMYLGCAQGCPPTMNRLGRLARKLSDVSPSRLKIVSIGVNGERPEALWSMWRAHGGLSNWSFTALQGNDRDATLARLGVWVFRRDDGVINHGLDLFLLDREGRVVEVFGPDEPLERIEARVREVSR